MSPTTTSESLVWVITGTSTGLGRYLALAALARGDKVIATSRARSLSKLDDLKAKAPESVHTMELDVTASLDTLKKAAEEAVKVWGRVDVVVNNAGYIDVGALEERTPEESLDQYQTNVFGALNVSRAFLPYMRERKTGTVVFIGSLGGWISGPGAALYASTKYAIRCLSESLHSEIAPLGLRSICFDFGYFRTDFLASDHRGAHAPRIADYKAVGEAMDEGLKMYNGNQPGNPEKGVQVMIDVVKGEGVAQGRPTPTVVTLGSDCHKAVKEYCESTLQRIEEWKEVSYSTDF